MTLKKIKPLAFTACLLIIFLSTSHAITVDRVVAVVNGEIITLSELQEVEHSLRAQGESKNNPQSSSELLDKLIDKKLQLQLADKKKITVSETQVKDALADIKNQNSFITDEELREALDKQGISLENFTKQLKEHIKLTILLKREVNAQVEINETEIKDYYEQHEASFRHLDELRAQHILLYLPTDATEEQIKVKKQLADKLLEDLKAGADFAQLAKDNSDDPSAEKGGDLGYFRKGEMLPALEDVALSLSPGEISPVLQTSFGFHILKLTEIRKYNLENAPNIREEIKQTLFREKNEEQLKKWLQKLRQEAKIKIMLQEPAAIMETK